MAQVGQKSETWKQKRANMRTSVSEHACARAGASVRACASACGGEDTANGCAKELLPSRRRRVAETMALVGVMRAGDNLTNNAKAQRRTRMTRKTS